MIEAPELPAESPLILVCDPLPPASPRRDVLTRFSPSNAREMGLKGIEAKRQAANDPAKAPQIAPDYATVRVTRVRRLLDQLDALAEEESLKSRPDAKRLKEFADAMARLQVQEQQLSGRPLPGSRKPAPDKAQKQSRDVVQGEVE